jgi:hypothetical protein
MKTKFAIGCIVQWYESEMINEYIISLKKTIDEYKEGEVLVDFLICLNQDLEKCTSEEQLLKCKTTILSSIVNSGFSAKITNDLVTIADYRRTFNGEYCEKVDVLMWGESDMLLPHRTFTILNSLHQSVVKQTPKYLSFFGTCKMWDDSWKPLEHPKFTNQKHVSDPSVVGSTWHTMTQKEMDSINNEVEDLEILKLPQHKFNGCGLIISSEVIKSGANIPKSVFFVHEDTAFMMVTNKLLGNIPQYVIKNILLVHNRKHPKKRMYVKDEIGNNSTERRESNNWYLKANKLCEENCYNIFNPAYTSHTWDTLKKNNK